MMEVKLPKLGEGSDSGTVVSVLVKEGDRVERGQTVMELENEKAVAPVPSPESGVVTRLRVKVGDKVSVGQVLLELEVEKSERGAATGKGEKATRAGRAAVGKEDSPVKKQGDSAEVSGASPVATAGVAADVVAPPSIRKMAREVGLDLGKVRGTGPGGRIGWEDVRAYMQWLQKQAHGSAQGAGSEVPKNREASAEPVRIDFSQWGPVQKQPLSVLRRTISRRLTESWVTIPHVTQFDEVDITELEAARKKSTGVWEGRGIKLTLTPIAIMAVVGVLKKHPMFNASLDEASQEVILKSYYHIGLAVDTEQGLLVPVIRDADKKGLLDLAREVNALGDRARTRKLSLEEMRGGTFTISNQGGFGGGSFTPIVNKPEAAILGLGRAVWKPAVREGRVEPRLMMPLGLSYDHRLIDGGSAARFVVDLASAFGAMTESQLRV